MMKRNLVKVLMLVSWLYAAHASAIIVDGVEIESGSQFWTTTVWETVLTSTSDTLSGVGIVDAIQGPDGQTWGGGDNNTQLTYYFHDYTVLAWYESDGAKHTSADADWATNAEFANAVAIDFAGGVTDMYTDNIDGTSSGTRPGTILNPLGGGTQAGDIAAASDGDLWAQYVGHTYDFFTLGLGARTGGSLYATNLGGSSVHGSGAGAGYLDIVAGAALAILDTNSFSVETGGVAGATDAILATSYDSEVANADQWDLSGSLTVKTEAIPEPSIVALLGIGLFTIVGLSRRRKIG